MKNFLNKINGFYIALIILLFIIITHIDIILSPLGYYFSKFDLQDLNYYINIRQYAVDSIMSGIFPFWTTRLFCGLPFFANSETAIFYLPNLIFYILPISKAVNISFLLHFFIFSFGVFLWIDNKIKDKPVSLTVALLSMFFSTFYLHSCAAHLSNIITVAWFPLLLYFYDKVFEKKNFCFIFLITFVISLQIFAGHFQYVYYSAIISLIYIIFFCRNKYVIITIFVSYLFSLFLTAIQFLRSLDFYFEGSRRLWLSEQFSFYSKQRSSMTKASARPMLNIHNKKANQEIILERQEYKRFSAIELIPRGFGLVKLKERIEFFEKSLLEKEYKINALNEQQKKFYDNNEPRKFDFDSIKVENSKPISFKNINEQNNNKNLNNEFGKNNKDNNMSKNNDNEHNNNNEKNEKKKKSNLNLIVD